MKYFEIKIKLKQLITRRHALQEILIKNFRIYRRD